MRRGLIGQALVEMALITPILLLLITGVFAVGLIMLDLSRLTHAAQEAAVAGATNPGDSCGVAVVTARQIYDGDLSITDCAVQGQYIDVTVGRSLELNRISPIWSAPVLMTATARAVLR